MHSSEEIVSLAISTCGPQLEVALGGSVSRPASLVRLGAGKPRSTLVLAAVDLLVENAGLTPGDLQVVVISRGPGSFTGIRAGLATAAGLVAATGADCLAYDSLQMHAARCTAPGSVWCAQPGRRGEVYALRFEVEPGRPPRATGEVEILAVASLIDRGPWVAAEDLELGPVERAVTRYTAAEALLVLAASGAVGQDLEPLYIEGPPIHGSTSGS